MFFKSKSHATDELAGPGWLERLPREAAGLACAGCSLFLLVTLVSFSPNDHAWSSSGNGGAVSNLAGSLGAWIADLLLSAVGYVAFLLPWAVLMVGVRLLRPPADVQPLPAPMRWASWMLVISSLAALCSLHVGAAPALAPQGAGGIAGLVLAGALVSVLKPFGATLILLTFFAACAPLALTFSWLQLFEDIGGWTLRMVEQRRAAAQPVDEELPQAAELADLEAAEEEVKPREKKKRRLLPSLTGSEEEQPDLFQPPPELPERRTRLVKKTERGSVPAFDGDPLPPIDILDAPRPSGKRFTPEEIERLSRDVEKHLDDFGVEAQVVAATPGPVITRFELQPAPGVKGSQITNLSKDLARALSVASVRVIEVIEGKSVIGLEIPNQKREMVVLREIFEAPVYKNATSPLTLGVGKDIAGNPVAVDLGKMPHLLVAGTTGSGKSVAINGMILSMLYKATKDQVRFIFIDPKMLELSVYEGIPHLLAPVVTDMKDAANALRWCVGEMERRYKLMSALGVRNLAGLNKKLEDAAKNGEPIRDPLAKPPDLFDEEKPPFEPEELKPLPNIVVIIDELADMMMVVGKKVEELIARLAQKARAAGIHLIVATQRPSVDVITGLIKANIP
ncbi:MAG TPA: DNA translocase FtsK 4TM domain-containing protein, partial [Nevskiaceae bacterium]|nr:DNA translocase FtsK 4TM domain-containing protein [Nevskiaceae bacterium]